MILRTSNMLAQELRVEAGFGEPGEHVRVEEAPLRARQDHGPALGSRFDQALGGEDLGRLPDDGPAHAEHAAQLALLGEDLAGGELAADDPPADALDDAGVDPRRSAGRSRRTQWTDTYYCMILHPRHRVRRSALHVSRRVKSWHRSALREATRARRRLVA